MGAMAFIGLTAVLGIVSLLLLVFRPTRPLGIGYLAGVGLAIVGTLIAVIIESGWRPS
jgi:predicted exporter